MVDFNYFSNPSKKNVIIEYDGLMIILSQELITDGNFEDSIVQIITKEKALETYGYLYKIK